MPSATPLRRYADALEALYRRRNRPESRAADPVWFVHRYTGARDREVAALVASALAYGRVGHIMKSAAGALGRLGERPARFLAEAPAVRLRRATQGFKHRFCRGEHLYALLRGARGLMRDYGSLEGAFAAGMTSADGTVLPGLRAFAAQLDVASGGGCGHLLPDPARGSACKRLNLMLRWLVRRDGVDPGGWDAACPAQLIVPLDVHMHRTCRRLGATARRAADLRTALEVTAAFRDIRPDDPVRYDFVVAHLGVQGETDPQAALERWEDVRA